MSGITGPNFRVTGRTAEIDGVCAGFSRHLAAFEACMRIRDPNWTPIGGKTYFDKLDFEVFELFRVRVAERTCP